MSGDDPSPWSRAAADSADTSPLPPPPPSTMIEPQVALVRTPRPGELTPGWRLVTAVTWIAVAVAIGSVWRASAQLGLSTWWIGPRGDQQPLPVQLSPFAPALAMVLAAINNVRRIPLLGLAASAIVAAVGIVDLGRVARLGLVEIGIGIAAAAVSLGSTTGILRPVHAERTTGGAEPDAR